MALTDFQRRLCRLIADNRIAAGESDVAGAAALNELIAGSRISRDIDLFHDTDEAVAASWDADRRLLEGHGFQVHVARERPSYVEAEVRQAGESVRVEWARDSAYRFFPLMQHADLGLVLHAFDLATNKVPALVGRLEVRDWVDAIHCGEHLQPLGYLAWAASGKDPGFGPAAILERAARSSHYSDAAGRTLYRRRRAPQTCARGQRHPFPRWSSPRSLPTDSPLSPDSPLNLAAEPGPEGQLLASNSWTPNGGGRGLNGGHPHSQ